jgi:hypothetical protein
MRKPPSATALSDALAHYLRTLEAARLWLHYDHQVPDGTGAENAALVLRLAREQFRQLRIEYLSAWERTQMIREEKQVLLEIHIDAMRASIEECLAVLASVAMKGAALLASVASFTDTL